MIPLRDDDRDNPPVLFFVYRVFRPRPLSLLASQIDRHFLLPPGSDGPFCPHPDSSAPLHPWSLGGRLGLSPRPFPDVPSFRFLVLLVRKTGLSLISELALFLLGIPFIFCLLSCCKVEEDDEGS